jgi:hypothetical protein
MSLCKPDITIRWACQLILPAFSYRSLRLFQSFRPICPSPLDIHQHSHSGTGTFFTTSRAMTGNTTSFPGSQEALSLKSEGCMLYLTFPLGIWDRSWSRKSAYHFACWWVASWLKLAQRSERQERWRPLSHSCCSTGYLLWRHSSIWAMHLELIQWLDSALVSGFSSWHASSIQSNEFRANVQSWALLIPLFSAITVLAGRLRLPDCVWGCWREGEQAMYQAFKKGQQRDHDVVCLSQLSFLAISGDCFRIRNICWLGWSVKNNRAQIHFMSL